MTAVVFWIFAAIAVLGALLCITRRSAVVSAVWLMSTMFALAAIFVLLNAQLIGILQVLVYVGAILVLFLFVVMLLNLDRTRPDLRGPVGIAAAVVLGGLLIAELAALGHYTPARVAAEIAQAPQYARPDVAFPMAQVTAAQTAAQGVVGVLARPLFQTYLVPFEMTSILLLAALVGAVVLAKRRL